MAIILLALLIFVLSFIYVWGSAPCWHFEKLWREKYSQQPEESQLINVGLAPRSRRQASSVVFLGIALLAFGIIWLFSGRAPEELAFVGMISAAAGIVAGLLPHHFGRGGGRIRAFFREL